MPEIYGKYASVYDRLRQVRFSLRMVDFIQEELQRRGIETGRLLESACGTGSAAIEFTRRGWDVVGVDRSADMLRAARRKALEAGLAVRFIRQDLRSLTLRRRFEVAVCLYDSVNYLLTTEEVTSAFERISAVLEPGGVFFFDFNTPYHFELANHDIVAIDDEDLFGAYRNRFDAESGLNTVDMTFFEKSQSTFRRWKEQHIQHAYTPEQMKAVCSAASLSVERVVSLFPFRPDGSEVENVRRYGFIVTK
jgi:SAM-dependent methyltransferase